MKNLHLSFTCRDYDRVRALIDGTVKPKGINLSYIPFAIDNFYRMIKRQEFDIAELSLHNYIMERSRGNLNFLAIPVFPHRVFRHSYIYVNRNSGIKEPQDLVGKNIGVSTYHITAAVWIRGILQHEYGVHPEKLKWFTKSDHMPSFAIPKTVQIQAISPKSSLDKLLLDGKLDALIETGVPSESVRSTKVRRLFPNFKKIEMDYYRKTRIFPIMHTVVIKSSLLKVNPWIAISMLEGFVKAKRSCYELLEDPRMSSLLWSNLLLKEQQRLLGPDPWPYNLKDNEKVLETLVQYSHEQGFIKREMPLPELFVESTLDFRERN